ncbi:hypothetical protein Tco_1465481 [Tanacetum coccineum]
MIKNGEWCWPDDWYDRFPMVTSMVDPKVNSLSADKIVWKDKDNEWETFSVSNANKSLSPEWPDVPWWKMFSDQVWDKAKNMVNIRSNTNNWIDIVQEVNDMGNGNSIGSIIRRLVFAASVYSIWQERNARIFKDERKRSEDVYNQMIETVKCKLLNLIVKESTNVRDVEKRWEMALLGSINTIDMEDRKDIHEGECFLASDVFSSTCISFNSEDAATVLLVQLD